jgi:flagellar biosynthetic protein FliO
MSPYGSYLLETMLTLMGVCALAFVLLYGARKMGAGRASGALSLLGRLPLDARRSIVLVKVGETVFVIGVGDGAMTKLGELPASDVPAGVVVESKGFAAVLAGVMGKGSARTPAIRVEGPARGEEKA